ncbi:MAG: SKP1 family protein [Cetobacterium sp.]
MEQIKIKTNDDKLFTVDKNVIFRSTLIKNICADLDMDGGNTIPLPNVNKNDEDEKTGVSSEVFEKIIEFCTHHKDDPIVEEDENKPRNSEDLTDWDRAFGKMPIKDLEEVLKAANYLEIKDLLTVCCKTYANYIKDKSVEEIREILGITNDFEPGEEEEARKKLLDVSITDDEKKDVDENSSNNEESNEPTDSSHQDIDSSLEES